MDSFKQRRFPFDARSFEFLENGSLWYSLRTPFTERRYKINLGSVSPEPIAFKARNHGWPVFVIAISLSMILLSAIGYIESINAWQNDFLLTFSFITIMLVAVYFYFRNAFSGLAFLYRGSEQVAFTVLKRPAEKLDDFLKAIRYRHYQAELKELERDADLVFAGIEKLYRERFISRERRDKMLLIAAEVFDTQVE